jgi:hypothetical protein
MSDLATSRKLLDLDTCMYELQVVLETWSFAKGDDSDSRERAQGVLNSAMESSNTLANTHREVQAAVTDLQHVLDTEADPRLSLQIGTRSIRSKIANLVLSSS